MKIYTKTGDKGTTGLLGGGRVSKDSPRVAAYGEVDELNALLGVVRAQTPHDPIRKALGEIQVALFTLGAQLASPTVDPKIRVITSSDVDSLERQMDVINEGLEEMRHFILPGGGTTAAYLHLARTVCRRAERGIVGLSQEDAVDHWLLIYVNRLSDFLFMMARLANQLDGQQDIPWVPEKT